MAFTVNEFRDLLEILRTKPEWKAELRRELLGEEILSLPGLIRDLTRVVEEMNKRLYRVEQDVAELKTRVGGLEADMAELKIRVGELEVRVDRLETKVDRLEAKVDGLETKVDRLEAKVDGLETKVGSIKGDSLERKYRERPFVYFRRILRKPRTLTDSELDDLLSRAQADGILTEQDVAEISLLDAIVRGRRLSDDRVTYLAVEVSSQIDDRDVARAVQRARLHCKIPEVIAVPVVAGEAITSEGVEAARQSAAWYVTNGHAVEAVGL